MDRREVPLSEAPARTRQIRWPCPARRSVLCPRPSAFPAPPQTVTRSITSQWGCPGVTESLTGVSQGNYRHGSSFLHGVGVTDISIRFDDVVLSQEDLYRHRGGIAICEPDFRGEERLICIMRFIFLRHGSGVKEDQPR